MNRDCNTCIHYIAGRCSAWECEHETLSQHDKKVEAKTIDKCINMLKHETHHFMTVSYIIAKLSALKGEEG